MVEWQESRHYDFGYNPTIALSQNNGQVLEEHETNIGHTLHLHTCRLDRGVAEHGDPELQPLLADYHFNEEEALGGQNDDICEFYYIAASCNRQYFACRV